MRRPFVYIAIPMVLGIVFQYFVEVDIYIVLVAFLAALIWNIVGVKREDLKLVSLSILLFFLGLLLTGIRMDESRLVRYVDKAIEIEGVVKEAEDDRYILFIDRMKHGDQAIKVGEKVSLKVIGKKEFDLGDRLAVRGMLKKPMDNTNPLLYNHRLNLLTKGIHTTISVRDHSVDILDNEKMAISIKLRKAFMEKVEGVFDRYLDGENSPLMKSMILGRSSLMDEDGVSKFRDLGLAHILAVSGLHIGVIAGFLLILFASTGMDRRINIALVITLLWLYAYIIGGPPSAIRSSIMFTLLLLAHIRLEPYDPINSLFLALFIMAVINPFWIFSVGFQLSFVATFFIIYLTPRIRDLFYPYGGRIINSVSGILAVQVGLFPLQAYYFNRFPMIGLLSNLLFIPLFSIALILGIVLIPFSSILFIGESIGVIIDFILDFQIYFMDMLDSLKLIIRLPSPTILEFTAYYIAIGILLSIIDIGKLDKRILKVLVYYCLIIIFISILALDDGLEIAILDVGQGDCILIDYGGYSYLVDTGGSIFGDFDIGKNIVLPYLEKRGIFRLKGVFISHFHGDHCKSLPYLMDNMRIDNIYIGYKGDGNEFYDDILDNAMEKDIPIRLLSKGDRVRLGSNAYMYMVGPDRRLLEHGIYDDNDLSMVLLLKCGKNSMLFTGDIEEAGEDSLVDYIRDVELLKVPHHGSNTSSSERFLDSINPRVGFISVGRNNSFGHPHEEVIKRYDDRKVDLYRTDEMGLITIYLDGENYDIIPFIKEEMSISYVVEAYAFEIIYSIFYIIGVYISIKYYVGVEGIEL
ncbi:MAG TPA: DNA internalization-related competence protein ComEC/Rec2 [Tepidimicrobium sp.]|nr:DNA internalization-related competence protein ComEC/Rec2 [Tepidimicrobium sp.]